MEQTKGLICTCDSGVARCQSKHQCHSWGMNLMLEVAVTSELGCSHQINVFHEAMNGCTNLNIH